MEANGLDPLSAAALVLRMIHDIDASDDERRDALLEDLVGVAWGSSLALSQ
jgi:hypothetical protein